jgi:hypothetical protein
MQRQNKTCEGTAKSEALALDLTVSQWLTVWPLYVPTPVLEVIPHAYKRRGSMH